MQASRPRASPGALLLLLTLAGLAACLIAIVWSTNQPWLGLRLAPHHDGLRVEAVSPDGPARKLPAASILRSVGPIELEAADLIEEPDFFRSYEQMRAFLARQSAIRALLDQGSIELRLSSPGGEPVEALLTAAAARPIADLPPAFWFQLFCGMAALLTGAWIWVLRPGDWGARMFAVTGAMFFLITVTAAVYSSRELALDGQVFLWLSNLNRTGDMLFWAALMAMFLCYPKQIVPPRALLAIPAAFLPWLAADLLQLMPNQDWGIRAPVLLMGLLTFGCALVQWRRTEGDPHARGALRWMSLSTTLGCGLFVLTTVLNKLLGWLPPLEQGYAFGFFLIVYVGIALGLRRYRLFDLDRWAFRILLWVGGAFALLMLDALLLLSLGLAPSASLGLSLLVIGVLYLPARSFLWHRVVDRRRMADDELFQAVLEVAFISSSNERARAWRSLLQRMFDPMELEVLESPSRAGRPAPNVPDKPALLRNGLAMTLPPVASSPALVLRYPWQGRELFGLSQVRLATQVVELLRHADASRDAYERGVAEERRRVARDLHDDLGARLLASLKRPDLQETRRTIREAIAEMRSVVAGLSGEDQDLGACIASLRHETASRLESSGIELHWPLTDGIDGVQVDYRICKNLSSMHRELVSNVIRHSKANRLSVSIELKDGRLLSRVRDDGIGGAVTDTADSYGLRNLRRRIDELKGRVTVRDAEPGTLVEIELPITVTGGHR